MAFEEFIPSGGRYTPTISLSRGGFGLSAGFQKKYEQEIGDIKEKGVKLFYDTERKAVAFKFDKIGSEGVLKIKKLDAGGYYLPAKEFLVKYDVNRDQLETRYLPKEEETMRGKLFVIELRTKRGIEIEKA